MIVCCIMITLSQYVCILELTQTTINKLNNYSKKVQIINEKRLHNAYKLHKKIHAIMKASKMNTTTICSINEVLKNFSSIETAFCTSEECKKIDAQVSRIGFHPLVQCQNCFSIFKLNLK